MRISIHIHRPGSTKTVDVLVKGGSKADIQANVRTEIEAGKDPKQAAAIAYAVARRSQGHDADVEELVDRFLAALAKQGHQTGDDAETPEDGHWVTLHGAHVFINGKGEIIKGPAHLMGKNAGVSVHHEPAPKPTSVSSKGVKNQVHELFSSGHGFSVEELQGITGAKLKQQVFNAINELKKGKGLKIEKGPNGLYQIVKEDGSPLGAVQKAAEPAPEPQAAPTPTPEPKAPEKAPPAPPSPMPAAAASKVMPSGVVVPPSPMSKDDADAEYASDLKSINDEVKGHFDSMTKAGASPSPATSESWAEDWQYMKSLAMAHWATNTSVKAHDPKPALSIEVFPADVALMMALSKASTPEEQKAALEAWKKQNAEDKVKVAAEKAAEAAKAAAKVEPPPISKPVLATVPAGESSFKPPETIVPDSHDHIDLQDFMPVPGASASHFVTEMAKAHKALHAVASDAVSNKKSIQKQLDDRLKKSPHFSWMQKEHLASSKSSSYGSLSARLISAWAGSSGDHQPISVAAQLAIRDAFKMNPDEVETKAFHYLQSNSEEQTFKDAAKALGVGVGTPEKLEAFKQGMRDFAVAQYENTQEHFKKLGIDHVYLVRGMKIGSSSSEAKRVKIKMQPASSFSTNFGTARSFAGGHSLFVVRVPTSQVIGSFISGYGCTSESEVVVLNHGKMESIQVGVGHAQSATSMSAHIKQKLGGGGMAAPKTSTSAPSSSGGSAVESKPITKPIPEALELAPTMSGAPASTWTLKAHAALKQGGINALNAVLQDFEEHKNTKGVGLPNTTKYMEGLKQWAVEEALASGSPPQAAEPSTSITSSTSSVSAAGFKMPALPPQHMSAAWKKKIKEAAGTGDPDKMKALLDEMDASHSNIPVSKGYAQKVHAAMLAQQKVNEAKAAGTAAPVKKNAYYYKKLKEKVLTHPMHSETTYKVLKSTGLSNEQVLGKLNEMYHKQYGDPAPAKFQL